MQTTADAVIIGGGAIGTSILYNLTMKGMRNVVLLEKGVLASGSTGDTGAIMRQHYSTETNVRLVQKSLEIFQNFPELVGGESIYNRTGWVFLVPEEAAPAFDQNIAWLKTMGVNTWAISVEELREFLPGVHQDGIARIAYEPDSGYADPHGLCSGYVSKAREQGASVFLDTPAWDIKTANGKVQAVVTKQGEISTSVVVNAAGPWARQVGQWVGLDLPLEISREQDIVLRPPPDVPSLQITISNMVDRTYFHPETGGLIICGTGHPKENEPADPDNYKRVADQTFIEDTVRRVVHRFPALERAEIIKSWAGLYSITPDWNLILDHVSEVEGFYCAVGGSGHAFKLAPAIGLAMAELIIDGQGKTIDISPLGLDRFAKGEHLQGRYAGNRA